MDNHSKDDSKSENGSNHIVQSLIVNLVILISKGLARLHQTINQLIKTFEEEIRILYTEVIFNFYIKLSYVDYFRK